MIDNIDTGIFRNSISPRFIKNVMLNLSSYVHTQFIMEFEFPLTKTVNLVNNKYNKGMQCYKYYRLTLKNTFCYHYLVLKLTFAVSIILK